MNPESQIIALKAQVPGVDGDNLQIFNLAAKQKVKSVQFSQNVIFWKWVTASKLGLVTATAVYSWDLEGAGDPVKVFDRAANLQNTQIISCRIDPTGKWWVLVGIAPGLVFINGDIVYRAIYIFIQSHRVCFWVNK